MCQFSSVSGVPSILNPFIQTSCTTGDPSTPKIALDPPAGSPSTIPSVAPSKSSLIIVGNFPAIKGGTKAHSSRPVFASIACKTPLFEPAYIIFFLLACFVLKN